MLYAKAFAVGVVTGVLAPVVVAAVVLVGLPLAGFVYVSVMSGAGSGPSSFDSYHVVAISPEPILMQMAVGFAIGFLLTLWRAMVKTHETR